MKKISLIYLVTVCFCICNYNVHAQIDTLSFLHITDAHLMFNLENYDPDIVHHREYTRNYKEANNKFSEFMETVPNQTGSNMIIATGDLIDFFDAKTANGNTLAGQIEQFARFLDQYHYTFYMTLGNHETFSYRWGNDKVIPDQLKTGAARAAWIRNFDVFRDGTYYSRSYQVGKTNFKLIFLDNSFYRFKKEENVVNPYMDKPQLHWLESELVESKDDVVVILMHIPFTDESTYPNSKNELYKILTEASPARLILSGHYHQDRVKSFTRKDGKKLFQVETNALVSSINHWRLIQLMEDKITVSSTGNIIEEFAIEL